MCAHGARMARFHRRTRRHRESLRNSLFNNRAFLLSAFRFLSRGRRGPITRLQPRLRDANSRLGDCRTIGSPAGRSLPRTTSPKPSGTPCHRQDSPDSRQPRPRLRRPASDRAGTVNLSGSCRICPRGRKPNPGHRAGRWAKPVRQNAYFPRQPELPRSDAQPLPRDFSSHASRVLEYASTADAADR